MTLILILLILSFLVLIHELGHFIAAKLSGVEVEEFGIGYPPRALSLFTWKGTVFSINFIPFGGFVKLKGEDELNIAESKPEKGQFAAASTIQQIIILVAGVVVNFLFGVIAFSVIYSQLGIPMQIDGARIGLVMENTPAKEAGLLANTNIIGLAVGEESISVQNPEEVIAFVNDHRGETISITTTAACEENVCPDESLTFQSYVRTADETPENEGSLGIVFQDAITVFYPWYEMPFRAMAFGLEQSIMLSTLILEALRTMMFDLFQSGQLTEELAGPVGIVHQAQQNGIFDGGFLLQLSFAAMLSINLAIMNLLPIPPLDGGKVVFIVLSSFVKNTILKKAEYYLNYGGYLLLLGLIVVITIRDIVRIF